MGDEGGFDGFKVDRNGRIWTSSRDGVLVFDAAERKVIAEIIFGVTISNICLHGPSVYVTGRGHLWRLTRTEN